MMSNESSKGRLGLLLYLPQPDGSYVFSGGTGDIDHDAGASAFLPITVNGTTEIVQLLDGALEFLPVRMTGDEKTQIVLLWDNNGRLGLIVCSPQPNGSYASSWGTDNIGQGSGALTFLPVTMNGDGKTQIVQLWDNNGRLGLIVYSPQSNGSYLYSWGTDNIGQGSGALTFLPVTMYGDGKTQIVQLWDNNGRLGLIVYSPQPNGSYASSWGTDNIGQGSGALTFLPVTMNGDGKTQIVQLWDDNGRLGLIVYSPQSNVSYAYSWGIGNIGQGSGALKFLPVTMNGDGKTQIVQLWDNKGRLGLIVYSPQSNGSYAYSWGTGDIGQNSSALAFLPVTVDGDGKTQIAQLVRL